MENDYLQKVVGDAMRPVATEMLERLESELSPNDKLAVATAIRKAACGGPRLGAVEAVARVEEQGIVSVDLNLDIEPHDPWAEAQGDGV